MERRLMVVGARPHSLGMHVATAGRMAGWTVTTAGVHEEDVALDVIDPQTVKKALLDEMPHCVVSTVGINTGPVSITKFAWDKSVTDHMEVNFVGQMRVLREWVRAWHNTMPPLLEDVGWQLPMHFVAISSNSADIARSLSAGYCASKAALSMALRCVARELAATTPFSVYSYEPGWLDGTPMSMAMDERLMMDPVAPANTVLHRIPGDRIINPISLSTLIVQNLQVDRRYLNGCTLRLDGGEQ